MMDWLKLRLKRLISGSSAGFTLVETLVSVAILSMGIGLIGGGIFQVLGLERHWTDDVVATKELRHAVSWFAGDALNAVTVDLNDGQSRSTGSVNEGEPIITLAWTDQNNVSQTVIYSYMGDRLIRGLNDGSTTSDITVASRMESAVFSRSGPALKFILTVNASQGGNESKSLEVYPRMLQ